MFKVQEQIKTSQKLKAIQLNFNEMQRAQFEGIEMSKVSNRLELKYGADLEMLEITELHYQLSEDDKLKSFMKIVEAQ